MNRFFRSQATKKEHHDYLDYHLDCLRRCFDSDKTTDQTKQWKAVEDEIVAKNLVWKHTSIYDLLHYFW